MSQDRALEIALWNGWANDLKSSYQAGKKRVKLQYSVMRDKEGESFNKNKY